METREASGGKMRVRDIKVGVTVCLISCVRPFVAGTPSPARQQSHEAGLLMDWPLAGSYALFFVLHDVPTQPFQPALEY